MAMIFTVLGLACVFYLLLSLVMTGVVQAYPRRPVVNPPDWGVSSDGFVAAVDGGRLETWSVLPLGPCCGTVVFMHGWGRNRDRMVNRARLFAGWGYRTILFSARGHGGSSRCLFMNALKFAEDIEAVLDWVGEPVILYGHSAGAGGAAIAASRNGDRVRILILEAGYDDTRQALLSLYRWVHPVFGFLFGPMILFWLDVFYANGLSRTSPGRLAGSITAPVLLIHGGADRRFPVAFARTLQARFVPGQADLYVAPGAGHSESSQTPGYGDAVERFLRKHDPNLEIRL